MSTEEVKLRDLDFTILGEELVPAELAVMIEERKGEVFKMTYSDNENLYICVGYGRQETGGYSITVDELYLTEEAVHVQTTLLGPDVSEKGNKTPSFPYIGSRIANALFCFHDSLIHFMKSAGEA